MTARSPEFRRSCLAIAMWMLLGRGQQQQQAPVAAEKQRGVMHACMSLELRWRSVLIVRL
ncbi:MULTISPECIES: hypothetical protein [unclassified Bradyrhizobium]|uniref:hypothetical protein n=1 Tax=unclassified Bradyrhizobium TaxID=2631580 RepID=UPI0015A5265F|nr:MULTISPECIES: hypothetical protein [unclassified Bradyrhizobium]MBB4378483.1 hypothetical protein [Bradyrhizobium sp. SBR1B]